MDWIFILVSVTAMSSPVLAFTRLNSDIINDENVYVENRGYEMSKNDAAN